MAFEKGIAPSPQTIHSFLLNDVAGNETFFHPLHQSVTLFPSENGDISGYHRWKGGSFGDEEHIVIDFFSYLHVSRFSQPAEYTDKACINRMMPLLRRKIKWGGYRHFLPEKWITVSTTTAFIIIGFILKRVLKKGKQIISIFPHIVWLNEYNQIWELHRKYY